MGILRVVWKHIIRYIARKQGFLDPFALLAQLRKFTPSSEVAEPIELLRAGALFHARGLVNRNAIQHNLDWVWPFWVEQQFNPRSDSFLPRGFSITHVNLTHRNWTAVGVPDCHAFPIVDPRGLVTPLWDGWSVDGWIIGQTDEERLLPSRQDAVEQELRWDEDVLKIVTKSATSSLTFTSTVTMELQARQPVCHIRYHAASSKPAWLVIALRPYNPEGISFVHDIALEQNRRDWTVNEKTCVRFDRPVERHAASSYRHGDVYSRLKASERKTQIHCDVGLATAAAMYAIHPDSPCEISLQVHVPEDPDSTSALTQGNPVQTWSESVQPAARMDIPDTRMQFLYDAAVRTLVLLSPDWTYPGCYTYKRFWYRDAAFLIHALLTINLTDRAEQVLSRFPEYQNPLTGYFHSQEGEWDSNGEVLWTYYRFWQSTGKTPNEEWLKAIEKGASWIVKKRLSDELKEIHAGLFPPGFSAEHLGNVDYYYWDDYWNVAGLHAAAILFEQAGRSARAHEYRREMARLNQAIERSLKQSQDIRNDDAIPASPYRRMDAGAVGSIVAGYPLKILPPQDTRLLNTAEFLIKCCFVHGAFFQDMIHSGMNVYLSLHIAQVLLRAGDQRFFALVRSVAELASPTGQWPEAIHPKTLGGCMGDGQHGWAAAEWIVMMRNIFVREEEHHLILGSGIPQEWLDAGEPLRFGPTPTPYGPITVFFDPAGDTVHVSWKADWRDQPPAIYVAVPGYDSRQVSASGTDHAVTITQRE